MANIFDYLAWRGDIPFSQDPFNEVDNLILSQLAYTDFTGIVPAGHTSVSLEEATAAFYSTHRKEDILANHSFTAKAPLLLEEMLSGARFSGIRLCRYLDERTEEMQLAAVTFLLPDGTDYVAFRGTDGTIVGWKEDFNISFLSETEGQKHAVSYLNQSDNGRPLRVGGHSKGGNLAMYAAAFSRVQPSISVIYNNDGPGFREEILEKDGFLRILPKIQSIVPRDSIIGMLLDSRYTHRVVASSNISIFQHDGFSWQVQRNRFVDARLSDSSIVIDNAVGSWLAGLSDEDRRTFTDIIFSLFEATGQESFRNIGDSKWKSLESIAGAIRTMPKERQQEALHMIGKLGQSSGQAAFSYLSSLLGRLDSPKA